MGQEFGGIDFRSLPIVTQAVTNLSAQMSASALQNLVKVDLGQEWRAIEAMSSSGITPSSERIKQYLLASCVQGSILEDKDKVILCIAGILRSEEETCCLTDPTLRDILVVLEASGDLS